MKIETEKLLKLINDNDFVEFGDFGTGVSEEWIHKAEEHLNYKLPTKYKWWLRNFGGGEIFGEEIYSIYEVDFDVVSGGDIVYISKVNQINGILPKGKVAVSEPVSAGEIYYFDLTEDNELVYLMKLGNSSSEVYADDFIHFIYKRINFYLG